MIFALQTFRHSVSWGLCFFCLGIWHLAEADAPVAADDVYVVDEGGTITVRASFPDTMTALDPSLYWRFNDTVDNTTATTIDRGSDSISSSANYSSNSHSRNETPTLRSSNSFKSTD